MTVYTFTKARQNLASLLKIAEKIGAVRIRHRDGRSFLITPVESESSPLDVSGMNLKLGKRRILRAISESRRPRS